MRFLTIGFEKSICIVCDMANWSSCCDETREDSYRSFQFDVFKV